MKTYISVFIWVVAVVVAFSVAAQSADPDLVKDYYESVSEGKRLEAELLKIEQRLTAYQASKQYVRTGDPLSATVRIEVTSPGSIITGSAFILECAKNLNSDGTRNCLVATVAHAFRNAGITDPTRDVSSALIKVQLSDKGRITNVSVPARFIGGALQSDVDAAYVVAEMPGSMVVPVVPLISANYRAAPNQPVIQYGYPNGRLIAEVNRRNIVSTTANRYIICSGSSASGNSGGLLVNSQGDAIGIASASGGGECHFTSFGEMRALAADPAVAMNLARYGLGAVFKK